jgi:hypothetical protein
MNFLIMQVYLTYHFIPLRSKYSARHSDLKYLQLPCFRQWLCQKQSRFYKTPKFSTVFTKCGFGHHPEPAEFIPSSQCISLISTLIFILPSKSLSLKKCLSFRLSDRSWECISHVSLLYSFRIESYKSSDFYTLWRHCRYHLASCDYGQVHDYLQSGPNFSLRNET